MIEVSGRQLAKLSLVFIAAGLLIGYGWAWIVSTPILQVTYIARNTSFDFTNQPSISIVPGYLNAVQGTEVLIILGLCGGALGIGARKIQEWNIRRLEEEENVHRDDS